MSAPFPRGTQRLPGSALVLLLVVAPTISGCYQEPNRFDQVQQETRGKKATSREAVAGGDLNKFFPKSADNASVTYMQEKQGQAIAELAIDGKTVATLSIFDTVSNPDAAAEYKGVTTKIGEWPLRDVGAMGSAVLVADRFQVQVRSSDANFSKEDREVWLSKFDLANLALYAATK